MDLRLARLETLAAVARHGSFSRAARELHLSQPAVSMQVHQLELALGLPLLERVGKRAFPTKAGELLLAHAGRALRSSRRASRSSNSSAGSWPDASGSGRAPRSRSTSCPRRSGGSGRATRGRS